MINVNQVLDRLSWSWTWKRQKLHRLFSIHQCMILWGVTDLNIWQWSQQAMITHWWLIVVNSSFRIVTISRVSDVTLQFIEPPNKKRRHQHHHQPMITINFHHHWTLSIIIIEHGHDDYQPWSTIINSHQWFNGCSSLSLNMVIFNHHHHSLHNFGFTQGVTFAEARWVPRACRCPQSLQSRTWFTAWIRADHGEIDGLMMGINGQYWLCKANE